MKVIRRVVVTVGLGILIAGAVATPSNAASMVEYAGHVSPNATMVEYAGASPNASMVEYAGASPNASMVEYALLLF
jgi:hypothetical protein